jgi:hypothetical protein
VLGHRPRLAAAALVAVFAVSPAACGGDEEADEGESTTTAPSDDPSTDDPTTTAPSVEAEVEAAYLAYWEMVERLLAAPDPNDQEIEERVGGGARDTLVDSLTTMRTQGERIEFGPENTHRVVEVSRGDAKATLLDCFVDQGERINDVSGERTPSPATPGLLEVILVPHGGNWIVDSVSKPPASEAESVCGI